VKGFQGKGKVLETGRLALRPLTMDDAESLLEVYSDPEVMKYWACEPMTDLDAVGDFVRRDIDSDQAGNSLNWAITPAGTDHAIGKCILFRHDPDNRRCEIGYILGRAHWRKGLMSEALEAVIDHAFTGLSIHRIEADTDPANRASLALLDKLGFVREGLFRDRWYVYGEWQDSAMLGLLKTDWEKRRRADLPRP
jgi:RimJ/RimL family protein N-acetyltransferase